MKRFGGIGLKRVLAYGGLSALLLALAPGAQAEWAELEKDDETSYFWDKNSVKAVHVSRYAWTLMDLNKATKAPNGENYQSAMTRWRVYCKTDMAVKLSVRPRVAHQRSPHPPWNLPGGSQKRNLR